jgi:hypothetical protein
MTREEQIAAIVADVMIALDCSARGEPHPRIKTTTAQWQTETRAMLAARDAAFYPPLPAHLRPARVNQHQEIDIGAWYDGMKGRHGIQRND